MYPQGKSKELFEAISRVNKEAYADTVHLANHVLSKTSWGGLLERYERGIPTCKFSRFQLIGKVLKTWLVHLVVIGLMLLARIAQAWVGMSNAQEIAKSGRSVTLLDIFVLVPKVLDEKKFNNHYLPGLPEALIKKGHKAVILARFYGIRNPLSLKRVFSILRKNNIPILTEYELFEFADWLALLKFAFIFPLHTLKLARRLKQDGKFYKPNRQDICTEHENGQDCKASPQEYISFALVQCLGHNYLSGEARRLAANRLAKLLPKGSKIIGWYENQVVDKCFYRGLKDAGADFFTIGAQLFTWPPNLLHNHPDPADGMHNAIPDLVLVNGPYFLPSHSEDRVNKENFSVEVPGTQPYRPYLGGPKYRVGPSLRYKYLFECEIKPDLDAEVLLLLSYHTVETERVLALAKPLAEQGIKLALRFHPATKWQAFEHLLPANYTLETGSIQNVLEKVSLVVGSGSGTLSEAVCMGLPVIVVEPKDGTGLNYILDYGKGELWDSISEVNDFFPARERLFEALKTNPEHRKERVDAFRSLLFTKPTEEMIIQAFEL